MKASDTRLFRELYSVDAKEMINYRFNISETLKTHRLAI